MSIETSPITASVGNVEINEISPGRRNLHAISGTVDLIQDGKRRATAEILGYRNSDRKYLQGHPLFAVSNGGPSSATTIFNGQTISGTHNYNYEPGSYSPKLTPNWLIGSTDLLNINVPGVGIAKNLDEDPYWAYGVQRNGEIIAAVAKCFQSEFYEEPPPTVFVGSSYKAGNGMSAWLKASLERDSQPAALALINGRYDQRINEFKYTDTSDHNQLKPFIAALPAMALANYFHQGLLNMDNFSKGRLPEEVYAEVAKFANDEYAHEATSHPKNPSPEVLEKLAAYLGLPPEVILEQNLRITPQFFCENLLPGYQLSAVEPRYKVREPYKTNIDPFIDNYSLAMTSTLADRRPDRGYSSHVRDAVGKNRYTPIIQAQPWDYPGDWKDKNAYKAMEGALKALPDLRIIEIKGLFDLNTVDDGFWDTMKENGHVKRVTNHYESTVYDALEPQKPGVDRYLLRMGHQLTDGRARGQVLSLLSNLAELVRQEAVR